MRWPTHLKVIRRLQTEALIRQQQLQSLNEIGLKLSAKHQLDDILLTVVRYACTSMNASYGAVVIADEVDITRSFTVFDNTGRTRSIEAPKIAKGVIGDIVFGGRTLLINDPPGQRMTGILFEGHPLMNSLIGVPISSQTKVIGGLYICNRIDGDDFTEDHLSALSFLATQSAVAVDNVRLYQRLARLSVLEERQRIAMELHDGAIQSLYALGLQLESLVSHRLDNNHGHIAVNGARQLVTLAIADINDVIKELRNFIFDLNEQEK